MRADTAGVFVGRERELQALTLGLEDALARNGRLFLISGEPGIGKSWLGDELASRAQERGVQVLVGRSGEAGGAPVFWPWVQAMRTLVHGLDPETLRSELGVGGPDIAQVVPELRELFPDLRDPPSTDPEGARFRLFDAVTSFLRAAGQRRTLMLVLDDLHAADEPSLLLLRFLARGLRDCHMLVLGLYRDVDPTITDPLATAVRELTREPVTRALPLTGLDESEVARLIELTTNLVPSAELATAVRTETEGNPFFVEEIVRLLAAERRLDDAMTGAQLAVPQSVKEVIGRRLRHLSTEGNRVLTLASVLGREFDLEALARVSELDREPLYELLDEAVSERVVAELLGTGGRLRFTHALIRDTVYEEIPRARRLELHRVVGDALEDLYRRELEPHSAEIAHHFFEARDARAIDYAHSAGDRAIALLAYEEAVRLYEMALGLIQDDDDRCELLLAVGHAQVRAGHSAPARQTFLQAAELARRLERPDALAPAALGYGGRVVWARAGVDERLIPLLREALAGVDEHDAALRARLMARLAAALGDQPDQEPRANLSQEAVDVARSADDPSTLAYALVACFAAVWSPENPDERLVIATELVDLSDGIGDKEREIEGHGFRLHALLELGEVEAAKAELAERGRLTDEMRQPAQQWVQLMLESMFGLFVGEFTAAEESIYEAFELGRRAQGEQALEDFELQRFALRREQGRLAEIESELENHASAHPTRPVYRCALANLSYELDRVDEARSRLALLAADDFSTLPRDGDWLFEITTLAETCGSLGDRTWSASLYRLLLPYAGRNVAGWVEVSSGAVSRYLGLLATTLERWEDAAQHFEDALAMNRRMGARPWLAHTQHDYGRMLLARRAEGDAQQATDLLHSALATSRELGMEPLAASTAKLLSGLAPAEESPEADFAGYRIEDEIGRGGMGGVYRATELSLERPVALKLITPELAADEGFRKRFLRESRLAASLDHPHVLPVFQAGEAEGQLYIAMRYVEGEDLRTLLRRTGKLEPVRAVRICGQVAEALDAAHRRGLVHRDLKPGNVLLDSSGEAYLADFGLTKQVGSASTQTGELVGTLDYLAPEQIRGEEVDGRTDEYALACVLYECLSGQAPFHRQTEAELLWAHMQEEPPSLASQPELDAVFQSALAKEKSDRYGDCSAFVEAAAGALGLETPRLRRRRRLLRRSRLLVAGGVVLLAAAAAAIAVEVTRSGSSSPAPVGNAVAAIDGGDAKLTSYTATGTTPSNVVIGGGSVWVLNADDRTISQIDQRTRKIVKTFATGGIPTDLAFGDGSLWVGNGGVRSTDGTVGSTYTVGLTYTSSVERIDPDTYLPAESVALPYDHDTPSLGSSSPISKLAAYGRSLWAINPDLTVSRIDTATNSVVDRVPVGFTSAIAAGKEGVWVTRNGSSVTRIDPRTGRIGQTISVPSSGFAGIAVGDGSVWTTAPDDGTVWRIEPGATPTTRTISVGFGVTFITFAGGDVWTANFIQGTVSRIDPRTNTVNSTTPISGTPQGLAADDELVWSSTAGGSRGGALPTTACSKVESGGRPPDLLIASDFPLQGPLNQVPRSMADAIRFVLRRHDYHAGGYVVGYQSCDDSTAQAGAADYFKCASNAKAYSQAAELAVLIGTYNSFCSSAALPIVNRASGGSLPMISPANTYTGLTRSAPGLPSNQPDDGYPTGVRNFLRVVSPEDVQAAADAVFAKQLGLASVYVLGDRDGRVLTSGFTRGARKVGLRVAGSRQWPTSSGYASLADRVAQSGADGVFLGGDPFSGGDKVIRAIRGRLGPRFPIIVTDRFVPVTDLMEVTDSAAVGTYVSFSGLGRLSPSGARLMRSFAKTQPGGSVPTGTYVPQTLQTAELAVEAIARSDGSRPSVLRELQRLQGRDGMLGPFRFDRNGDVTPAHVTVFRITGRNPKSANLVHFLQGSVPVRVISVPTSLLGPGTAP